MLLFIVLLTVFEIILPSPVPKPKDKASLEFWDESHLQNPEELGNYLEGDLIVPKGRNGLINQTNRWENGIIPYEISSNFDTNDKNLILHAMDMYKNYTCISFRPKIATDKAYISITNYNSGCWSHSGKQGKKQELNLQSPQCTTKLGTVLHELMHASGFLHEQNRHERDDYVTIKWENILDDKEHNFRKAENGYEEGFGVPYDYMSVMHYSSYAFSSNGKRTIVTKDNKDLNKIGQRKGFSIGDIIKINTMYNCPEKTQQLNITEDLIESHYQNPNNNKNNIWNTLFSFL